MEQSSGAFCIPRRLFRSPPSIIPQPTDHSSNLNEDIAQLERLHGVASGTPRSDVGMTTCSQFFKFSRVDGTPDLCFAGIFLMFHMNDRSIKDANMASPLGWLTTFKERPASPTSATHASFHSTNGQPLNSYPCLQSNQLCSTWICPLF